MQIDETFFDENPLPQLSAAEVAHVQILMGKNQTFNEIMNEAVLKTIPKERRQTYQQELEQIRSASTSDEIITLMRKQEEVMCRSALCLRALELQETVLPAIVKRFYKNRIDNFLECAAIILYHADEKYLHELYQNYREIWSPYAQALVCLLISMCDYENTDDFLLKEYQTMKRHYPEETYYQFPLLALYISHGEI